MSKVTKQKFIAEGLKYYINSDKNISTEGMFFSDLGSFRVIKRIVKRIHNHPNFDHGSYIILLSNNVNIVHQSFGKVGCKVLLEMYLSEYYKHYLSILDKHGIYGDW